MVHPIFTVLISKPELVMQHVSGYASLMRDEASSVGLEVAKRAVAGAVAVAGLLVFLVLTGVGALGAAQQGGVHRVRGRAPPPSPRRPPHPRGRRGCEP